MSALASDDEICPNCGKFVTSLVNYTGWCSDCSHVNPYIQIEDYLARNADHIEHHISTGHSLISAIQAVRSDTRPVCSCCGVVIKRGPRNSIFCSRNQSCRSAKDRYNYLHKRKGIPKAAALAQVLREIGSSDN